MSKIGDKIKRLREKCGLTQDQLASKTGMHRVSIAQIETGRRPFPTMQSRKKIAKALKLDIRDLLD